MSVSNLLQHNQTHYELLKAGMMALRYSQKDVLCKTPESPHDPKTKTRDNMRQEKKKKKKTQVVPLV